MAAASNKAAPNIDNLASHYGPDYSTITSWEENFDIPASIAMFQNNSHFPYLMGVVIYLSILYFGQKLMANREPFKLRVPLILWNSSLAIFSIVGFFRVAPEMFHTLNKFGFQHTICNNSWVHVKPTCVWIYLFVLSKSPELVDTIFLVLKKQKLIFLHVYHHSTVLIFSWFIYHWSVAAARWFCTMNFFVHSIMYTYYALKAMPNFIKIPKWISMLITTSQTLQMVIGTYVQFAAFYSYLNGKECATNMTIAVSGLIIYVSYLFLFSHFFYKAYIAPTPRKPVESKKEA